MTDNATPEEPQSFSALVEFLTNQIEQLEAERRDGTFKERRDLDKKLKGLRALQEKAKQVAGK